MRIFLNTCILGMLAAGIYGTIDLSRDLKNGTFIQYEEEEDLPSVAQFSGESKGIFRKTNVKVAIKKETKKPAPPTLINSFSDLEFSDFSRGEPPMVYEAMLLEKTPRPDSVTNEVASATHADTTLLTEDHAEKTKNDSSATARKENKFSLKLYSRSRPPRLASKEEVVLASDTISRP